MRARAWSAIGLIILACFSATSAAGTWDWRAVALLAGCALGLACLGWAGKERT